ncbi:leucine-rich repeat and guanylate kinase domain-containing protein isoform X2 [Hemibagrus wyckioides]|uniref:leucine-rich repeat and guanylate kinase domain-containing protein isoform X2 n=1 Tax=Hemibagrus wyckioides TaxID=337641 RepID=UPI00266C9503|nr:leucine-rich repeat and guanylate kinase domain-containing protein isoform X2 [Hemibagrus wyckioides]
MPVSVQQECEEVLTCQTEANSPESWDQDDGNTTLEEKSPQAEEEQKDMEDGELTEDEVSKHLSDLGRSATGLQHVYLSLSLPRKSLKNVSILSNYIHIQKLELPNNKIKDLSCVSHMPYLIKLDASHNDISNFFGFQPPKNLKEVDFSHNHISSMKDLSAYTSLRKLILGYNFISEVRGLEKCSSLTHLSMEHNKILRISGLKNLPLRQLCLKGNLIKKIENLQTLRSLQILDLSSNRIQSLSGLQDLHLLGNINLESNMIGEIKECTHVQYLLLLRELNLKRNPIQEQPDYRLAVIFILNHLTVMDERPVTVEEKVSAVNKYDPSLELVAARDHMNHVMYQHIQPQAIFDSTLPSLDTPYPMLVLTGPQACGKRELAHKLCHEYSDYFGYGTCHTTRGPYFGEEDGCDYHFVQNEEFQNMTHMGYFVQTMQYGGNWYGLSREAIESVAREGLACCVHMELEGVFSLKTSYFEPRYILLIPTKTEDYISHMKARSFYTDAQIEKAVSRIELYAKINRKRPGFFDSVILCDDRKQAYSALKQLIKEYLGLEEQEKEGEWNTRDTPQNTTADEGGESTAAKKIEANPTDVYSQNYYKVQARLLPQKTSAELASIHRRQQMVREALVGKIPRAYTQLFKRYVHTAPSLLTPHSQSGDRNVDSSSEESCASSGLSMNSSAGVLSVGSPADGLDAGSGPKVEPLDVSLLGQNLETLKDHMEPGLSPDSSRSAPELVSSPGRPGSKAKPILPPIPQGRKATESGSKQQLTGQAGQVDEG